MKSLLLLSLITFCSFNSLKSQSFVNDSNKWYVDYCGFSFETGTSSCETREHRFGNRVIIDSIEYWQVLIDAPNVFFSVPDYYREENGKVFVKETETSQEYLIYDFTAGVGDQIEISYSFTTIQLEVLSVEFIELNSGEIRKMMEVARIGASDFSVFWIEGVGGLRAPMNSERMFDEDVWTELNCYLFNDNLEYSIKDCALTNVDNPVSEEDDLTIYPNPGFDHLYIESNQMDKILFIDIFDLGSNRIIAKQELISPELDINHLTKGVYFLKIIYQDGSNNLLSFLKK